VVGRFRASATRRRILHETYFRKGGFEAVYDELDSPIGLLAFASNVKAEGAMFSARQRAAK